MRSVHLVVPDGIDDPERPSGGNTYDRRLARELTALGWTVTEHPVAGSWPAPDSGARADLGAMLAALADGGVVVLDGLVASCVPEVLVPESGRLRLVALVHLPLGSGPSPEGALREQEVLAATTAVVTTSGWTRSWLLEHYRLDPDRVHVARPGVDVAELVAGTPSGGELLCVGAVLPDKGHDVLLRALARVAGRSWALTCVGSLARDPAFVDHLGHLARKGGIADRVRFTGPLTRGDLEKEYAAADVLVQPSLAESYGMVVTEALARGLPVLATRVGGLPEALGRGAEAGPPGLLVPPGDPVRLADALRWWLDDPELRVRLRRAARERRSQLTGWSTTARQVSHVLAEVAR